MEKKQKDIEFHGRGFSTKHLPRHTGCSDDDDYKDYNYILLHICFNLITQNK